MNPAALIEYLRDRLQAEQARTEAAEAKLARLRALMAEAVQADLNDDTYTLEAAIVKMAAALDEE